MKFIVSRTSVWDNEQIPCLEARPIKVIKHEVRTCSEKEFDRKFSRREGKWREKGCNHTITKQGYIKRTRGFVQAWAVEIETLQDFIKFYKKHGSLVIKSNMWNEKKIEIEIYDNYRE